MNAILEQINSMGKAFVEFAFPILVQSSVLIVILLLVDLALRERVRAVFRYCIWMLVLAKLVLPSSLSSPLSLGYLFGDSLENVTVSSARTTTETVEMSQPLEISGEGEAKSVEAISAAPIVTPMTEGIEPAEVEATGSPVVSMRQVTWQGVVFLVWLVVVGAMVLLLLQRVLFVRGLVAQARDANSLMNDAFKYCCGQIGMKSEVGLKVSANATSPAVCGLFRPVILVPQNLGPSLGSSHLRAVLLHELAHIKRRDLWVNLVQTVLQIIYFYNPLLWLANAVIRRVREQAVDETVQVAMGERAQQYPETLVNVAKLAFKRPALSLRLIGVVESKSALKGRIKHLLNRPIPKSAKLGILGLIVVLIIGAILLPMATSAAGPPEFIIKGTVTDAGTGQPIAGAKVGDVDKYANGRQRTITDSDGKYSYATWYEEHGIKAEAPGYEIQHKGLYTKLFGSEKEKVLDFQLTPEDVSGQSQFKATLSSGVTVELVGVCEYPSEGKQWWRPDGTVLPEDIHVKKGGTVVARGKAFAFAVKVKGPEDMTFTWGEIEGSRGTADLRVVDSEGQTIGDMEALKAHVDETRTTTSMRIGVAPGPWETEVKHDGIGGIMSTGTGEWGIVFSGAYATDQGVKINVSDDLLKINHRIIAVDLDGKTHIAQSSWGSAHKIRQTAANFEGLSLEQIKEFQFQTRPYEWVEFKNVSLRPGVKTDVGVGVAAEEKEKVVRKVSGVNITPANFDIRLDEARGVCNFVVSIENQSDVTLPKFKLRFYRGEPANNMDEAGNVHSGWHEAGPIEPSKSWNECTRDFHLPDGQYEFHVILDYDDNLVESDETNNRASMGVIVKDGRVTEKKVDLTNHADIYQKGKTKTAKVLKIVVYEGDSAEPEVTLKIPLVGLKIANSLLPPKVKEQMSAQGIELGKILEGFENGLEATTLLDVKEKDERVIISLE